MRRIAPTNVFLENPKSVTNLCTMKYGGRIMEWPFSDPKYPIRKSYRLKDYDYRQPGGYFVTICTFKMANYFGSIRNGIFYPNTYGNIVQSEWFGTSTIRPYVKLYEDEFALMPNHLHGIIWITDKLKTHQYKSNNQTGPKSKSLGAIIGQFKSKTSKRINKIRNTPGESIWQRNYYDHIIRSEKDLRAIRKYILDNPVQWEENKIYKHNRRD